jgi:hypothetical protein
MKEQKQQVFYIHGGESYETHCAFIERLETKDIWDLPSSNSFKKWTSTLAADLGSEYEVFMPAMPNKNNAQYEEWKIWFERHFEHLRDDVILMGCSLGAMFLTRYFIENTASFRVKALVIMACPVQEEGFYDEDSGSFRFQNKDLPKLAGKAERIIVMHSKDDFLVPYRHALEYTAALPEAELVTFEDKNHFLVEELPELVERIKALC